MATEPESLGRDLEATLAARAELGREYEPALVESFVERLDATIERRVDAQVAERTGTSDDARYPFVLGVVSLGTGIPISGIAAGTEGLAGLMVAWGGIVGVNAAYALSHRRTGQR
ncbi:MAG: hypothetical protein H0V23_00390 [Nocardioidaceae bacterium]|nr:hypothetical protein [Nocardioidaceae bacterium]